MTKGKGGHGFYPDILKLVHLVDKGLILTLHGQWIFQAQDNIHLSTPCLIQAFYHF